MSYFRVKAEQERVTEEGPVPWSMVRATQFHELALTTLTGAARWWGMVPVPRARLQTVACAEVAPVVADVAEGTPRKDRVEVAGPEVADAGDLARAWRSVTGRRVVLVPVPVPGNLGRALRGGVLTTDHPDVRGIVTFTDWLAARQ